MHLILLSGGGFLANFFFLNTLFLFLEFNYFPGLSRIFNFNGLESVKNNSLRGVPLYNKKAIGWEITMRDRKFGENKKLSEDQCLK